MLGRGRRGVGGCRGARNGWRCIVGSVEVRRWTGVRTRRLRSGLAGVGGSRGAGTTRPTEPVEVVRDAEAAGGVIVGGVLVGGPGFLGDTELQVEVVEGPAFFVEIGRGAAFVCGQRLGLAGGGEAGVVGVVEAF